MVEPRLPLSVPVGPREWIVLALGAGAALAWMMGGVLVMFPIALAIPTGAIKLLVCVGVAGMLLGFWLTIARLAPVLSRIACAGTLTIDRDGLRVQMGAQVDALIWSQPVQVRRWQAGFIDEDGDVYEGMYAVWQLTQGDTQITLSRQTKLKRRRLLSQFAAVGEQLPPTEKGLVIPHKAELVFAAIADLGELQFID